MTQSGGEIGGDHAAGKAALITGIGGQDGTCLAQLLVAKGYRVTGTTRGAPAGLWRLDETGLRDSPLLDVRQLNLADADECADLVSRAAPDEVYNLGGLSFIGLSFAEPLSTARTTGLGAINLLEAIRVTRPSARFFQASSSEMFGDTTTTPQGEEAPFHPRSPYAVAKLFAHWSAATYRDSFGIFAASGILYNHESPLRGMEFVTRKITDGVARIRLGLQESIELGNLESSRDWGYAPEYVEAMWRSLQIDRAESFVLASGRLTSVRSFVEAAFQAVDIRLKWEGHGLLETGCDGLSGTPRVRVSPSFFRPLEKTQLCGRPEKAYRMLGWKAQTTVAEICRIMVDRDIERLQAGGV